MDELQQIEEQDKLFEAAGAIKGSYLSVASTPQNGMDIEVAPMPKLGFACANEFFTATMALINEKNLFNGIIEIPNDVCVAAKLPVYKGAPEPSEDFLIDSIKNLSITKSSMQLTDIDKSSAYESYRFFFPHIICTILS